MESGGYLRGSRLHFQFEDLCDRSEDGFASMVPLLTVRIGQLTRPFCKGCNPAGLDPVEG